MTPSQRPSLSFDSVNECLSELCTRLWNRRSGVAERNVGPGVHNGQPHCATHASLHEWANSATKALRSPWNAGIGVGDLIFYTCRGSFRSPSVPQAPGRLYSP